MNECPVEFLELLVPLNFEQLPNKKKKLSESYINEILNEIIFSSEYYFRI